MAAKQVLVTKLHKSDERKRRPIICYELQGIQRKRVWTGIRGTSAIAEDKAFALDMIDRYEAMLT